MRVLVLVDKLNWAYHSIAKSLKKYNTTCVQMTVMPIKNNAKAIKKVYEKFDLNFVMGWQTYELVDFLPKQNTLIGLHSFHSWDDRKTTPERDVQPPKKLIKFLSGFKGVNVVSMRLYLLFKKHGLDICYTPNGVDTSIFVNSFPVPVSKKLVVGYSGSKGHDWRKGVSKFIIPAAKKSKVKCKLAMSASASYLPLEKMSSFYNKLDCYVCASSSEGMSLSVLEAASCGRPIISTRCSGSTEIVKDGETGFFVNRSVDDITRKISMFRDNVGLLQRMSRSVREDICKNWGWDSRAQAWMDFMRDHGKI